MAAGKSVPRARVSDSRRASPATALAQCSFASEVAALVAEEALDCLDAPIRRVTALDTPMPFSPKQAPQVCLDRPPGLRL